MTWTFQSGMTPYVRGTSSIFFVRKDDDELILKLLPTDEEAKREAAALAAYRNHGAVNILEHDKNALLLARIIPGTELKTLAQTDDNAATSIFCDVAKRLHKASYSREAFPSVETLKLGFTEYLKGSDSTLDKKTVEHAKRLYLKLCQTQKNFVLLHGDLHHENILFNNHQEWLVIDPKGYIGEPEFEVAAFMKNPLGQPKNYATTSIFNRRLTNISENLNLNRERMVQWTYALTVLSIIWKLDVGEDTKEWIDFLERIIKKQIS